jgi:hypothetical protein
VEIPSWVRCCGGCGVSRLLSQTQVASRVWVSMVESGKRVLQPDLARRLDHLYGTGTMISALAGSLAYSRSSGCATLDEGGDVVLIELPLRGVTVPVSRRAVLAALSVGTTAWSLPGLRDAAADVPADEELLAEMTQSLAGLHAAGRVTAPARLIDTLLGQVAILDVVRRRAPQHLGRKCVMLQTQYAETLSWMTQESGDLQKAAYWVDRGGQWAAQAQWPAMNAYAHVRRSALASTFAGDGPAAVGHALHALHLDDVPARVLAQATKQMAYGYALAGNSDACRRALERTGVLLDDACAHGTESDSIIGLRIDDVQSALTQFEGTCDTYLGGGEHAINLMDQAREQTGPGSRNHAVTGARLARAYAQAGEPGRACALALDALNTGQVLDSMTTRTELHRALAPLNRWPGREDVAEVRHRINALT